MIFEKLNLITNLQLFSNRMVLGCITNFLFQKIENQILIFH